MKTLWMNTITSSSCNFTANIRPLSAINNAKNTSEIKSKIAIAIIACSKYVNILFNG
jgi:hypothetical protein